MVFQCCIFRLLRSLRSLFIVIGLGISRFSTTRVCLVIDIDEWNLLLRDSALDGACAFSGRANTQTVTRWLFLSEPEKRSQLRAGRAPLCCSSCRVRSRGQAAHGGPGVAREQTGNAAVYHPLEPVPKSVFKFLLPFYIHYKKSFQIKHIDFDNILS